MSKLENDLYCKLKLSAVNDLFTKTSLQNDDYAPIISKLIFLIAYFILKQAVWKICIDRN